MNKIKRKIMLATSSMVLAIFVPSFVTSCGKHQDNLFSNDAWLSNKHSDIKVTSLISVYDFIKKCFSINETKKTFIQYTNFLEFEKDFNNIGIFVKQISSVRQNSLNSISCEITFIDKDGNNDTKIKYIVTGFVSQNVNLDNAISDFKEKFVPFLSANVLNTETSSEVWDMWWNTKANLRTSLLYSYIRGLPLEIINDGVYTYNGNVIDVSVPNVFENENEAKKKVFWNEDADSELIKGKILFVTFSFSIRDVNGSIITKDVLVEIDGFVSFENKLNYFANLFLNSKGNITINDSSTPVKIICGEFDKEKDYDLKLKILSKYLNNVPNPYLPDSNNVVYKLIGISQSVENVNAIKLVFSVCWNNVETEISFDISGFVNDLEYFSILKSQLALINLVPTQLGLTLSSEDVYNEFQEDPTSIYKYIKNIPVSTDFVKYNIRNVYWNENDNIQLKGTILNIIISLSYEGMESEVKMPPINGFVSPFSKLSSEFDEKCSQIEINLTLKDSEKAKKIIVDNLTLENINEYVSGIPLSNDIEIVNELSLDFSNGIDGVVNISFLFIWKTQINMFERKIQKSISGFKKYSELSFENYSSIINDMNKKNYLELIKKEKINYSDWLTSYFAYDQKTPQEVNVALLKIWNLPTNLFGIDFKVLKIQYSKTNNQLSDTQLLLQFEIKDIYNNYLFTSSEFVVDGFFDPYTSTIRNYVSKTSNSDLNDSNIKKYYEVHSSLQMGDANWQSSWVSWGNLEPYKFYYDGRNNSNYRAKWVEFAKPKAQGILSLNNSSKATIKLDDARFIWNGDIHYGNSDSKGTRPAPISIKFTYYTKAIDNKGNFARNKYNGLSTNYLTLWLYFKNCWWNG